MMRGPRNRVHIARDWQGGHRLYVCEDQWGTRHANGVGIIVKVATGFTWVEREEGGAREPTDGIPFADDLIQAIVDKGWEAGFRPRALEATKNETTAVRDHLKDMRMIAFNRLGIETHD